MARFELRITHAEDDEKGAQIVALVVKLGGDAGHGLNAAAFGIALALVGSVPRHPGRPRVVKHTRAPSGCTRLRFGQLASMVALIVQTAYGARAAI